MLWSDVREYVQQPIAIPWSGWVRIDLSQDPQMHNHGALALDVLQAQVDAFCSQLFREFAQARSLIATRTAPSSIADPLLPWLAQRSGPLLPMTLTLGDLGLAMRLNPGATLPGQALREAVTLAQFSPSGYADLPMPPVQMVLESLTLEPGSLIAKLKGSLKLNVATLSLALSALGAVGPVTGPVGQQWYQEYNFNQQVQRTVLGQPCEVRANWHVDLTSLRQLGLEDLDYSQTHLNPATYALRVCNVQLALALSQGSPSLIDGKPGQQTRAALAHYAKTQGLQDKTDIHDERLRGHLLDELQRRRH